MGFDETEPLKRTAWIYQDVHVVTYNVCTISKGEQQGTFAWMTTDATQMVCGLVIMDGIQLQVVTPLHPGCAHLRRLYGLEGDC